VHRGRLRAQKLAEVLVFFAPRSFHEVRSERERCAAESDERDLRRQLGANDAQGVANVGSDRLAQRQSFDGFARPQRCTIDGPGLNWISTPSASSGVMMSLKMMAASSGKRRNGCSVISAAISGVRVISRKDERSLIARYSGDSVRPGA